MMYEISKKQNRWFENHQVKEPSLPYLRLKLCPLGPGESLVRLVIKERSEKGISKGKLRIGGKSFRYVEF